MFYIGGHSCTSSTYRAMATALFPLWGLTVPHPHFSSIAVITIATGSSMCSVRTYHPPLHVPPPDHLPQAHSTPLTSSTSLLTTPSPPPLPPPTLTLSSPWHTPSPRGTCNRYIYGTPRVRVVCGWCVCVCACMGVWCVCAWMPSQRIKMNERPQHSVS